MITLATPISSKTIPHLRRIDENIIAGGQPLLPEGIAELYGLKVKSVLDLQGSHLFAEAAICKDLNIRFFSYPLPGIEIFTDPPREHVDAAIDVMTNTDNYPLFVHCAHGKDRTGMAVAIYQILHGADRKWAIKQMRKWGNSWIEWGYREAVSDYFERHPLPIGGLS